MKFLGILKKEKIRDDILYPEYILCTADTIDKQIHCLEFKPLKNYHVCAYCGWTNDICYFKGV